MEIIKKTLLLDSIEQVGNRLKMLDKNEQSSMVKFETFKDDLQPIMDYLACSETQSLIFCSVFFLSITEGSCHTNDIAQLLKCSPFEMIRLNSDFQELIKNKFILRSDYNKYRRKDLSYHVPAELVELISNDMKSEPLNENMGLFEVADVFSKLLREFRNDQLSIDHLHDGITIYQKSLPELGIFSLINKLNLKDNDKLILIYIFTETCDGAEKVDIQWGLNQYIPKIRERFEMRKEFLNNKSALIVLEAIETCDNEFRSDSSVRLTKKASELIFGDELLLFEQKVFNQGPCTLIEHASIVAKELYYDENERKELDLFENVIQFEGYNKIVEKLTSKNLPTGISTILHGYPGTGKTESVYQLARKSKRNILMVDISKIRDKYVGESEKKLKEVFNVYRKALVYFEQAPILLFNESDALISKRTAVTDSVDQMNNSMQNILLQEMENFKGILMATTNLINNLDSAFERRFLFKIKFSKPSILSRTKIWQNKIETISEQEAAQLAADFEFSGGQIDNITKKMLMRSLISDKPCSIDDIIEYCQNELFVKKGNTKVIGFTTTNNLKNHS